MRKVARLARLAVTDEQVESYRGRLATVLNYFQRLQSLDLQEVEPLNTPLEMTSRLEEDTPGPTLATEAVMELAPQTYPPFIQVPKVLGDGGAA